ncbi:nitronate monooxygenase [Streptomyces massasporeus]|uniref:nitronate monooxygenase n=1 Tax=Streptomyces massasporeus TaxID=67324 RepID=UPI00382620B0
MPDHVQVQELAGSLRGPGDGVLVDAEHRSDRPPGIEVGLPGLVDAVRHALALPVIAEGGIAIDADVTAALRAGAGAVTAIVGTVLLRSRESGRDRGSGRCCGLWLPPTDAVRWAWSHTEPEGTGGVLRLERPSPFGSRLVVALA